MRPLTPLSRISVPETASDEVYRLRLLGEEYRFEGLKRLLAAADIGKAGDRNAGLAASTERSREAARSILASLALQHLFDRPLTGAGGKIDEVMRVNYDIDPDVFATLRDLTVGGFKDRLLKATPEEASRLGSGLTGVMAAATAKLCDTHELIYIARKISRPTRARTRLGLRGTLSSRLQPNHPTDDLRGIRLLTYLGLSVGSGDALLGVNPAVDTVENVDAVLRHLDRLRRETGAPTQICVLSHIRTQMKCLRGGAPVEIMFQSLAGTDSANTLEFDISVDLLDEAHALMMERGPLGPDAAQFMYFETGQGSEFTYGRHEGIDMTTLEALCYGLARRYDPFMVNNVTGFIGPETHAGDFEMIYSCLQDHFMAKLLGLPMGMAPCYTLHADIRLEGQQIATQLLAAAGANYYMDVCLNTDRMLAYFDTSGHDDQTLREIHDRRPTPEFEAWAIGRGIFSVDGAGALQRGPRWGDPTIFVTSPVELDDLRRVTPALYGWEHAGPRPASAISREVRMNQAVARDAVHRELDRDLLERVCAFREIATLAKDRRAHLDSPSLGARVAPESLESLAKCPGPVQVVVTDGLSAEAVHENIPVLLPVLFDGLTARGVPLGTPLLARYGRVKLAEDIALATEARLVILLLGERPGGDMAASRSLSAYLAFRKPGSRGAGASQCEYTVISNIYSKGLPPLEAAAVIVDKVGQILRHEAAGNRLEAILTGGAPSAELPSPSE